MTTEREGVIKYQLIFDSAALVVDQVKLAEINDCRGRLIEAALLGEDPSRYGGLGFGNVSFRAPDKEALFYISSTQTGHLDTLRSKDLACVKAMNIKQNTLYAQGESQPSSEAMTHAALYQMSHDINAVVHVHSPDIWRASEACSLASTSADIAYGTPDMAFAVQLLAEQYYRPGKVLMFAMKGHEDGIVAAGPSLTLCTNALLVIQERAKQLTGKATG